MTCADKFKKNSTTTAEATDVEFVEVDGRPRCVNAWCRRQLLGDGTCPRGCAQAGAVGFADASMEVPLAVDSMGAEGWEALSTAYVNGQFDYSTAVRVLRLAQYLAHESGAADISPSHIDQALQLHAKHPVNRVGSGEGADPETIAGHTDLKRAVELALAGGHPLGILFDESSVGDAWLLAEWARNQGVGVRMTTRCACGQPPSKCTCSEADRARWQGVSFYQGVQGATVLVAVTPPTWEETQHRLRGTISPLSLAAEAAIPERAFTAGQAAPVTATDPDTDLLVQAAVRDLNLDSAAQQEVLALAGTAARLDGAGSIQLRHMVEALAYFPRGRGGTTRGAAAADNELSLGVPPELAAAAAAQDKVPGDDLYRLVRDRLARLADEVDERLISAEMRAHILAMIRFHRYSLNNQILISLQCYARGIDPNQLVAAHDDWQKMGRRVKKGERGIQIIWGKPRHKRVRVRDEVTGEEREEERSWIAFGGGNVFLESQTEGEPIPRMPKKEMAEVGGELDRRVVALIERQGIQFRERATLSSSTVAYAEQKATVSGATTTEIYRRSNEAQQQRLRASLHELAHVEMGHLDRSQSPPDEQQQELEADACAYVVAQHYGYDFGTTPNYIALHARAGRHLHQSMERIARTAKQIIEQLEAQEEETVQPAAQATA